jgi:hypothetical protein
MEVAQIVITPKISEAEKTKVKINLMRKRYRPVLATYRFCIRKILQQQMVVL